MASKRLKQHRQMLNRWKENLSKTKILFGYRKNYCDFTISVKYDHFRLSEKMSSS